MGLWQDVGLEAALELGVYHDGTVKLLLEDSWILIALNQCLPAFEHKRVPDRQSLGRDR